MHRLVYADWGWREYADMLRCFVRGHKDEGPELSLLIAELSKSFPQATLFPVNRGRVGLTLALRALAGLASDRQQVIYPAYICNSVIEAIERAGLEPVPADVGLDLNLGVEQASAAVTDRTLAVIVAHAYGCPAPIADLEQFCRRRGIFLVDDAANVVGVETGGRSLGGFGDIGLLSFTTSKSIVAGWHNAGGMLIVNNSELVSRIEREWQNLSHAKYTTTDLLLSLRDLQFERYFWHMTYYYREFCRRFFGYVPRHVCEPTRMPNISATVALRQISSFEDRMICRIGTIEEFYSRIVEIPGVRFPQYASGRYLTRVIVELPFGVRREQVQKHLERIGVATRAGYELDFRFGQNFPYISRIGPLLLELPSSSRMADTKIEEICGGLSTALQAGRASAPIAP